MTARSQIAWRMAPALAVFTTACTIGPKYARPSAPAAPSYKELQEGEWKPAEPGDQLTRGAWWLRFEDPELNQLEAKLNAANQSVLAAAANVQAARAVVREARSQYFPSATVNPAITNSRLSTAFGQTVAVNYTEFSLPVEASWEPDLWGRVRNTVRANTAAAQASAADLENTRLAAQAQLAVDYYQLRAQDMMKRVLDSTVVAYQESLDLTRDLYRAGLDNDEAVAQAEAQLKVAQAQDLNLGVLRAQYEHAIAVLVGEPASSFSIPVKLAELKAPAIPVGVPSELLERRPDIAASERGVAQANAQIGIARSAFYPSVTLSASFGVESLSIAKWLTWPARVWSVGPGLAETIFDAGLRRATVQQYQATYDQTVANYRQTVLTAFQQVEDNLAALRILAATIAQQDSAIESAERNLAVAEVRYRAGLDPYLNVIAAQTILLNDQQAAVTFRAQNMVAAVQLVEALGGGWEASRTPSEKEMEARPAKESHGN